MIYYAFKITALLKSCLWRKDSVVAHCEVGLQTKVQGDGQEEEGWRLKNRRDTMQSVVKEEPLCRQGTPTSGFIVSVVDPCFVHWSLQRPVVARDTGTLRLGLPSGSNLKKGVMLSMFSTLFDFPSYLLVDWRSSACRPTVFSSPFLLLNECIHTIWDAMKRNIFAVNDDDDDMMQVHPFFSIPGNNI